MTPERAAELAHSTTQSASDGSVLLTVRQAILQACKEQREKDAKICDDLYDDHDPEEHLVAEECAAAIRGAE